MQGKKFGIKLIQALDAIAKEVGCYKVCYRLSLEMWLLICVVDSGLFGEECSFLWEV